MKRLEPVNPKLKSLNLTLDAVNKLWENLKAWAGCRVVPGMKALVAPPGQTYPNSGLQ